MQEKGRQLCLTLRPSKLLFYAQLVWCFTTKVIYVHLYCVVNSNELKERVMEAQRYKCRWHWSSWVSKNKEKTSVRKSKCLSRIFLLWADKIENIVDSVHHHQVFMHFVWSRNQDVI